MDGLRGRKPRVTLAIHPDDHAWLLQRQREASADRKAWITMPDLVHEFVVALQRAEAGA